MTSPVSRNNRESAVFEAPKIADVRLVVVYDANAYRGISGTRALALKRAERNQGFLPAAGYPTVRELLAKVADPAHPEFRPGRCALYALLPRRRWISRLGRSSAAP